MKIIHPKYGLLTPFGVGISLLGMVFFWTFGQDPEISLTGILFFMFIFVVAITLPFLGLEYIFAQVFRKSPNYINIIKGFFLIIISSLFLVAPFYFILNLFLPFGIIIGIITAIILYLFNACFYNDHDQLTDDYLSGGTTLFLGFNIGVYGYWLYQMAEMANNTYYLLLIYPIYVFCFYTSFFLSELKKHRKVINIIVVVLLSALLVDTFLIK